MSTPPSAQNRDGVSSKSILAQSAVATQINKTEAAANAHLSSQIKSKHQLTCLNQGPFFSGVPNLVVSLG